MTDFSVFTQQAHVELVEHALLEVLAADSQLESFFTSMDVTPEPFMFPEGPLPLLTVSAITESDVFQLNSETENTLQIALGGFYDELREKVTSSERTVKSLLMRLKLVAASNWRLAGTSISTPGLVDRIEQFEAIPFPPIVEGEDGNATFNFQLIITYQYSLDVLTGLRA